MSFFPDRRKATSSKSLLCPNEINQPKLTRRKSFESYFPSCSRRLVTFYLNKELNLSTSDEKWRFCSKYRITISVVAIVLFLAIIIAVPFSFVHWNNEKVENELIPPDPVVAQPPSWSKLRIFKKGAVCVDGAPCAAIGKSILEKNGSAVDAAIAALICNGLVTMQSMGLGGGFIMTIYERSKKRAYVLNARERAPLAANSTMFDGKSEEASFTGGLSIAVPGELAGYWEAHKRFGKLPWLDIFAPSIDLCENGYVLAKSQYDDFQYNKRHIYKDPTLKSLFVDPETGSFVKPGSLIKPRALCKTLRIISQKNVDEFYGGSLGEMLVEDLETQGGIITIEDLKNYRATWDDPVMTILSKKNTLFTPGLPGSGALLALILNILEVYKLTPRSIENEPVTVLTYHRMLEAYKHAFALRTAMGDLNHVNMTNLTKKLVSKDYANKIRMRISDIKTWNDPRHYGASNGNPVEDQGTSHVSVLAPNGDAVSVTSTINFYFGSGLVSERTGILLNNGMDDFGISSRPNYFGILPSPANYIEPGKRSLSSMVPSIIVDDQGDVKMVIGAAGGTKIITAVSQVIARILWMGETIKQAVDSARIHHQLIPLEMAYEYGVPKGVVEGLKGLGHKAKRYRARGSVVCLILQENGTIYANADYRKSGEVYGID